MKQSLELKFAQRLTMTPQLQQAIRLLQLSAIELQEEIQQALEENPLLEEQDDGVDDDDAELSSNVESDTEAAESNPESLPETDIQFADDTIVADSMTGADWEDFELPYAPTRHNDEEPGFEIDARSSAPTTLRDHLLWQLAHQDMQAYKDEDGWFLIAMNKCQFLKSDGGCNIYETRPQICRDYSNDFCEYDASAEEGFEYFFKTYEELDKYCRKRFKKWDKRFTA